MRESSLVARYDDGGREIFRVSVPVSFTLEQTATALHAVVDPHLAQNTSRDRVGRRRVPEVLRQIARDGWPAGFRPAADRVAYWQQWLIEQQVFIGKDRTATVTAVETGFTPRVRRDGHVTAVLNQKGGVGKTGATAGTAGALAERGRRVLMLDMDPQGHLTTEALGIDDTEPGDPDSPNLANALIGSYSGPIEELIVTHSTYPNGGRLDIIPTTVAMFLVVKRLYQSRSMEWRLSRLLDQLAGGLYDHVVIDCPPSLDVLTDNALAAAGPSEDDTRDRSGGVLIPVQPSKTSLRALRLLLDQLGVLEAELRLQPRDLYGLVPSLYRKPLPGIGAYVMGQLQEFGDPSAEDVAQGVQPLPILAHLPLATAVEEAWLEGKTITSYAPRSALAGACRRLAIRLDVAAGLAPQSEWDTLGPLPQLAPMTSAAKD